MFSGAINFNSDISSWDVASATSLGVSALFSFIFLDDLSLFNNDIRLSFIASRPYFITQWDSMLTYQGGMCLELRTWM